MGPELCRGSAGHAGAANRVARAVAEQIRVTVNQQEQAALQNPKVVNAEAYEAYLKGRYFWNKRTGDGLKKAIDYFQHAIEYDPNLTSPKRTPA
jgi:hypothetical protein